MTGTVRVDWHGNIKRDVENAGEDAAMEAGEALLEEANKTVPFDEGDLKASATITKEEGVAVVGYSAEYAIAQHEGDFFHEAPGRRKWLEQTAKEEAEKVGEVFAKGMDRRLPG